MGLFDRFRNNDDEELPDGTRQSPRWQGFSALADLTEGDPVSYKGRRHTVRGRIDFNLDGFVWTELRLVDTTGKHVWVSVENDGGWEAVVWTPVRMSDVIGGPGDRTVELHSDTFRRSEADVATYQAKWDTGVAASGKAEYADYRNTDGKLLSFERFGPADAGQQQRLVSDKGTCTHCGAPADPDPENFCSYCRTPMSIDAVGWRPWEAYVGQPLERGQVQPA